MKRFLNTGFVVRGVCLAILIAVFYWLLPVAATSRLSADHVRWAMGEEDISSSVVASLSSVWAIALAAVGGLSQLIGGIETSVKFATAAAFSAWISILAIGILSFSVPWPALLLAVLAPTFLWTSVVPNGTSLVFLLLALMSHFSKPDITYIGSPRRWTLGAVIDGLACSLSPAAWILVLLRAVHSRDVDRAERARLVSLRLLLFVVGFSLHFVVAVILNQNGTSAWPSFALIPVVELLRSLRSDDVLSAGAVFLGGGGESVMGLLAALNVAVAITVSPQWQTRVSMTGVRSLALRGTTSARWALLLSPFLVLLTSGNPSAWKIAHPGANTIVEDFSRNVARSLSRPTAVFVNTATEEAGLRYVREILSMEKSVAVLRPHDLFDATTQARIASLVPGFSLTEAVASVTTGSVGSFFETVVVPNVERGVNVWLEAMPGISGDLEKGLEIHFLGNGFLFFKHDGPTRFRAPREGLRGASVRFRPTAREFTPQRSIEIRIFERYATFHMGTARMIEFEKKTPDWKRRARGEYYAALKKVEWYPGLYEKVCIEEATEVASGAPEKPEPLDVCVETAWFHRP